jgi:hypothetical protein
MESGDYMKLVENKYLKCFSQEKFEQLKEAGYKYLYESNDIFYFLNSKELTVKFSNSNLLEDTKLSMWINF